MEAYPKRQAIQDFLSYAGDRLHEKGCVVTADVFGTIIGSETDVQTVGQDYTALDRQWMPSALWYIPLIMLTVCSV